jgi:hypothetical protein
MKIMMILYSLSSGAAAGPPWEASPAVYSILMCAQYGARTPRSLRLARRTERVNDSETPTVIV